MSSEQGALGRIRKWSRERSQKRENGRNGSSWEIKWIIVAVEIWGLGIGKSEF